MKKEFQIKDFFSCRTEGVNAKRSMCKRIQEHIQNIRIGFTKHSVSRHFAECHNKNPTDFKFWAIDKYKPNWKGSNRARELSKNRLRWIFEIN